MTKAKINRAFLGLGGNLGHPLDCFKEARRRLSDHPQIDVVSSSPIYRTPPIGGPSGQPDYLNAVLEIATDLPCRQVYDLCQAIEKSCGRTREIRWAARTLDIDLLFVGQLTCDDHKLTLPHPRLHTRHFVLLPLADLAPEFRHQHLNRTVKELLEALPEPIDISKIIEKW